MVHFESFSEIEGYLGSLNNHLTLSIPKRSLWYIQDEYEVVNESSRACRVLIT